MGQVLNQLARSICCCDSLPALGKSPASSVTKMLYCFIFITEIVLLVVSCYFFGDITKTFPFCSGQSNFVCEKYSGYITGYRIAFSYGLFFFLLTILTVGITRSRDSRSVIHSGFWFLKFAFLGLTIYSTSYIPYGYFDIVIMHIAFFFSIFFIMYQFSIFLKLFAFVGESLWKKYQYFKQFTFVATVVIFFLIGIGLTAFLIIYYATCRENVIFISINIAITYAVIIISIILKIAKKQVAGIIKGSILCNHVMFLTWYAVANNPDYTCHPSTPFSIDSFEAANIISMIAFVITIALAVKFFLNRYPVEPVNPMVVTEERGRECCGIWGKKEIVEMFGPTDPNTPIVFKSTNKAEDEYGQLKYDWCMFHHLLLMGSYYFMLMITYNYHLYWERDLEVPKFYNLAAMWYKMVAIWLCILYFIFIDFFLSLDVVRLGLTF